MKRVLLDENLDRRLKNYFSAELDVTSVPDLGWQSKKNGELLTAMDVEGIAYLLTADRNLQFQQNLERYDVVIVVVATHDVRIKNLSKYISEIEEAITNGQPTQNIIVVDLRK
jgi:predicted nuclease of predicted toxin-antitoxin system